MTRKPLRYPRFELIVHHEESVTALVLFELYAAATQAAGFEPPHAWAVKGMGPEIRPGGFDDIRRALGSKDLGRVVFICGTAKLSLFRSQGRWTVQCYPDSAQQAKPDETLLRRCVALTREVLDKAGFITAVLERRGSAEWLLYPPLFQRYHMVVTSDAEVARAYDDPDVYWRVWDEVEARGEHRICVRDLDAVDDVTWLERTFEDTMELGRWARRKVGFGRVFADDPIREMWWNRGEPTLRPVGYDPEDKLVEYTGFCPPGEHVRMRELYEIWLLAQLGEDAEGQPIDTVRVVFYTEEMARAERRPLQHAGARVYYLSPEEELIEVTD